MSNAIFKIPEAKNEPVYSYASGSAERKALQKALAELRSQEIDVPMIIGGKEVFTDNKVNMAPPHDIHHKLGSFSRGDASHVQAAINAAMAMRIEC